MKKQSKAILSSLAVVAVLGACSPKNSTDGANDSNAKDRTFVKEVTHEGTPIKGGTLKYAIVSASPFNGLFIDELASDSTDTALAGYVDGTMFEHDENRKLVNSGLASLEFDVPGKSLLMKELEIKIIQGFVMMRITKISKEWKSFIMVKRLVFLD